MDRLTVRWTLSEQEALCAGLARWGDDMQKLAWAVPGKGRKDVLEYYFRRVYSAVQLQSAEIEMPLLLGWEVDRGEEKVVESTAGKGPGRVKKAKTVAGKLSQHAPAPLAPPSFSSSSSVPPPSEPPTSSSSMTISPAEVRSQTFLDYCRDFMDDALFEKLIDIILALHEGRARPAVAVEMVRGLLGEAVAAVGGAGGPATITSQTVQEGTVVVDAVVLPTATGGAPPSTTSTVPPVNTELHPPAPAAPAVVAAPAAAAAAAAGVASVLFDAFLTFLPADIRLVAV